MPPFEESSVRFWRKVEKSPDCWRWTGAVNDTSPYGKFSLRHGKMVYSHRYAWEEIHGAIAEGLTVDHLCANTLCVNPDHMELVPLATNIARGRSASAVNARKTHCKRGHELVVPNIYIRQGRSGHQRVCRLCRRITRMHSVGYGPLDDDEVAR